MRPLGGYCITLMSYGKRPLRSQRCAKEGPQRVPGQWPSTTYEQHDSPYLGPARCRDSRASTSAVGISPRIIPEPYLTTRVAMVGSTALVSPTTTTKGLRVMWAGAHTWLASRRGEFSTSMGLASSARSTPRRLAACRGTHPSLTLRVIFETSSWQLLCLSCFRRLQLGRRQPRRRWGPITDHEQSQVNTPFSHQGQHHADSSNLDQPAP